mmetsp:Transcript_103115/g.222635  ORF Transcript_103115/g.222635 Transcript_103115/m.222635 type:complete len:95 (+) Transcript_103115:204-488(+)
MQAGFAMLEMGSVRDKNSQNILLKNVLDICIATMMWLLVGYGIAWGESYNGFMGVSTFLGSSVKPDHFHRDFFFQWAFTGTSATIISGCLAERC